MVDRVYERNTSESAPAAPADPQVGYPTAGNPAQGVPATVPGPYWFHMITESLRRVVVEAGITPDHEDLDQLLSAIQGTGQFAEYSTGRTYSTGDIVRGSDGQFYEFYDRDGDGTVQGVDPTNSANRPHIWMEWDGVKPGATIEWRSETLPEGYVENDGAEVSRADYRRVYAVHGTTYGAGDGSTTFLLPDDRGEFKRGLDRGRGVDSGRSISSQQSDAIKAIRAAEGNSDSQGTYLLKQQGALDQRVYPISRDVRGAATSNVHGTGGSETRPRNNAVIYLTKI